MNKLRYLFKSYCCVGVLVVVIGCARKTTPKPQTKDSLQAVYIQATALYHGPELEIESPLSLRICRDSIIWLSARPFFGLEALRATATPAHVQYIQRLQGQYARYAYEELTDRIGLPLQYGWIENLLLGQPILKPEHYNPASNDSVLYFTANQAAIELWTTSTQLDRQDIKHASGYQLKIAYHHDPARAPTYFGGLRYALPTEIEITLTQPEVSTTSSRYFKLSYQKVHILAEEETSFPFDLPEAYENK